MPNGHGPKEYGGHKYDEVGSSDCHHGCGCSMAPASSSGPMGLDPFGICPKNPKDGLLLGGNADYEYVVNSRIDSLKSRLSSAEYHLSLVSPGEEKLGEELAKTKRELAEIKEKMRQIQRLANSVS